MHVAFIAVAIALSLCAGRLLQLQGFDSAAYGAIAAKQLTQTLPLLPTRGEITDRNGVVMAATEAAVAITADPTLTAPTADKIADIMSAYLTIDRPAVLAAVVGGSVAALTSLVLPAAGIVAGAVAGVAAAMAASGGGSR